MDKSINVHNPVLRGMYPDPSWFWDEESGKVVIVNSSFELVPGLPIHSSTDFGRWSHIADAVDARMAQLLLIEFSRDSGGLYAPTLRKIRGRYVIACTVARLNVNKARSAGVSPRILEQVKNSGGNFVLTATDLHGPWQGPFWVEGAEGIDPDVFEDADGSVFWTQTRPVRDAMWSGQTEIWTQRINPDSWSLLDSKDMHGRFGKTVLWRGFGVESIWSEGPHLYRIGDYVYLLTAEGGTGFDHSAMIMRTEANDGFKKSLEAFLNEVNATEVIHSSNLSERSTVGIAHRLFHPNPKNPFLTHRHLGLQEHVQCVGHADLLRHPTAGWWAACLGIQETFGRDDRDPLNYVGRETFVMPLEWRQDSVAFNGQGRNESEDLGWPVISGDCGLIPNSIVVGLDDAGMPIEATPFHGIPAEESSAALSGPSQEHIVIDDTRVVGVRSSLAWKYVRIDSNTYSAVARSGRALRLYRDSDNHVDIAFCITARGSAKTLECTIVDSGASRVTKIQVPDGHDLLGMALHGDILECYSCGADEVGEPGFRTQTVLTVLQIRPRHRFQAASIDVRFLSTEHAGGFVGCLIGVRDDATDEITQRL